MCPAHVCPMNMCGARGHVGMLYYRYAMYVCRRFIERRSVGGVVYEPLHAFYAMLVL